MIRVIEQSASHFVQKVYSLGGKGLRYQAVPRDRVGDSKAITVCSTLAEARKIANIKIGPKE